MDKKKKIIAIVVPIVIILLALIIVLCLVLPKKNKDKCADGHTYEYTQLNDEKHTKKCSVCGKVEEEDHKYESATDTDCECGYHRHIYEYIDKDDTNHTKKCRGCNEINVTEEHRYESATATECADCGHHRHVYKYTPKQDGTGHIKTCIGCDKINETESHRYDSVTKPIVDTTKAVVCDDCGYSHTHTIKYENTGDHSKHKVTCTAGCNLTFEPKPHSYDGETDATCNDGCGYERPMHTTHTLVYTQIDDTEHRVTCSGCDEVNFTEPHNRYDSDTDTTCACGYERTLHPADHIYVYTDLNDGTHHSVTCSFEGCDYSDKKPHTYDDDNDTTCNDCGHVRDVTVPHVHSPIYTYQDNQYHKKTCETCGKLNDVEEHVNENGVCKCGYFFASPSTVSVTASKTDLAPGDEFTLTINISSKRTGLTWSALQIYMGPLGDDGLISPELGKNFKYVRHTTSPAAIADEDNWIDMTEGQFDDPVEGSLMISSAYAGSKANALPSTTTITFIVTLQVKETATIEGPIKFGVEEDINSNVVFSSSDKKFIFDNADGTSNDISGTPDRGVKIDTIELKIKKKTEVAA